MTTAVIYVDQQTTRPVIDGEWHRMKIAEFSEPGQPITMLCGASGAVQFRPSHARRSRQIPRQCESCDRIYRLDQGIPLQQDRLRIR
ncbi:hypothetical protein ACIA5G_34125 [Amycolatopsis sp. NPDC051758]|uniref:hypothetical protein n=1 Tax=Amycolatopsis sp. NPDC051758 TaxID=3363935 RepID=UPI0037949EC2